jgi:hypothetical protein
MEWPLKKVACMNERYISPTQKNNFTFNFFFLSLSFFSMHALLSSPPQKPSWLWCPVFRRKLTIQQAETRTPDTNVESIPLDTKNHENRWVYENTVACSIKIQPSSEWWSWVMLLVVASLAIVILMTFMLLESSIMFTENIYSTGVTYDCKNIFIVQATGWGNLVHNATILKYCSLINFVKYIFMILILQPN